MGDTYQKDKIYEFCINCDVITGHEYGICQKCFGQRQEIEPTKINFRKDLVL